MKYLTSYQLSCNGYMVSELGQSRISLIKEHGVFHLKHSNIIGAGQVWEVLDTYRGALNKFKALRTIQKGNYALKNYEVKV